VGVAPARGLWWRLCLRAPGVAVPDGVGVGVGEAVGVGAGAGENVW
jgi:hypothetical protein